MATPLKIALVNHDEPMCKLALRVGVSETRLSRQSTGLFEAKEEKKSIIKNIRAPGIRTFSKKNNGSNE